MNHNSLFKTFLACILLFASARSSAQVDVTSSNDLDCTHTSTVLTATFEGDNPTPSGIEIDDEYPDSPIPIGFSFNFYGITYNQCLIGPNGTISFNVALAGSYVTWVATGPLLGQTPVLNSICGPWCDIDISPSFPASGTITYSTTGIAPYRKFIVTFCKAHMFSCTSQITNTQIILYESSNIVETHIGKKDICTTWYGGTPGLATIGVQNATGTAATAAPGRDFAVFTCDHEAWRFTPDAPGTAYTCTSISYKPVPYSSSLLYWYNATTGAYLGTGASQTVAPTVTTTYKAGAIGCADTSFAYYTVVPGLGINITTGDPVGSTAPYATSRPALCGGSDGTFTILGLTPGSSDTINYNKDGVAQPTVIAIVTPGGTVTIGGLPAGVYDNIVVKQDACLSNAAGPVTITDPPIAITAVTVGNPSVCGATDGTLTLVGLYPNHIFTINYTRSIAGGPFVAQPPVSTTSDASGTITLTGLAEGVYDGIIASYSTPCTTPPMGPYTLVGPPPPNVNVTSVISPSECGACNGSITIKSVIPFSSDTITYTLGTEVQPSFATVANSDSSIYLPGLCKGTYTNFSVKIGQCVIPVNGLGILVDPPFEAHFTEATHLACLGDSAIFTNGSFTSPTGNLYYMWSFGDGSSDTVTNPVHIYPEGTYTVHLTATNHFCNSYDSTVLTFGHPLKAIFTETPDILCQGQSAIATNASVGATGYTWYLGNGATATTADVTYTYANAGTYNLQLVAANAIPCYDTAYKTIYVDTISGFDISLTDSVLCAGTYITMTGAYAGLGNTGVSWVFGDGDSVINMNPVHHAYSAAGVHTITATAHYRACADAVASRTVTVLAQPSINLGADFSICKGSESVAITDLANADNALATYVWSTGATGNSINVVAPGLYYATVNVNNCYASDSVEVANDCYVNIPNAFTPNGDGVNDYFFPRQYLARGLTEFKMNIYNRWGQLIFESASLNGSGWDGRLNGVAQESGVYVYIIDAKFRDGQKEHHQGNVTLLR